MTEPDNFILRWARLKRDSDSRHKTDFSQSLPPQPKEKVSVGADAAVAEPRAEAAADDVEMEAFSLPD